MKKIYIEENRKMDKGKGRKREREKFYNRMRV